jgi:hypothetical protein
LDHLWRFSAGSVHRTVPALPRALYDLPARFGVVMDQRPGGVGVVLLDLGRDSGATPAGARGGGMKDVAAIAPIAAIVPADGRRFNES